VAVRAVYIQDRKLGLIEEQELYRKEKGGMGTHDLSTI
jgi:hypothetical protein